MNYTKSKAPLALMEQLIMILVFAAAAAVCMQAFVYSDRISRESEERDAALIRVQEVIECCKAEKGDLEEVCRRLTAKKQADGQILLSSAGEPDVYLQVVESTEYLETAVVTAKNEAGEEICSIRTAWQKGGTAHE